MTLVFSDIEGTVLDGDMARGFVEAGREHKLFGRGALLAATGYLLLSRISPRAMRPDLRWRALLRLVAGHTPQDIIDTGRQGLPAITPLFKREMLDRIAAHRASGDTVVMISGGMSEAAQVIAESIGASRGEGTRCAASGGRYNGKMDGPMCTGENKAARARQIAAELGTTLTESVAYGDSAADVPMLVAVGRAIAVDPDAELAQEAARRGWEVMVTKKG